MFRALICTIRWSHWGTTSRVAFILHALSRWTTPPKPAAKFSEFQTHGQTHGDDKERRTRP
jgi:hypothetical protein